MLPATIVELANGSPQQQPAQQLLQEVSASILLLQGQKLPARIVELREASPRQHSEQHLLQQEQAQQAARLMRRVKPPLADCLKSPLHA